MDESEWGSDKKETEQTFFPPWAQDIHDRKETFILLDEKRIFQWSDRALSQMTLREHFKGFEAYFFWKNQVNLINLRFRNTMN